MIGIGRRAQPYDDGDETPSSFRTQEQIMATVHPRDKIRWHHGRGAVLGDQGRALKAIAGA
jgi:hypothetical protein